MFKNFSNSKYFGSVIVMISFIFMILGSLISYEHNNPQIQGMVIHEGFTKNNTLNSTFRIEVNQSLYECYRLKEVYVLEK